MGSSNLSRQSYHGQPQSVKIQAKGYYKEKKARRTNPLPFSILSVFEPSLYLLLQLLTQLLLPRQPQPQALQREQHQLQQRRPLF